MAVHASRRCQSMNIELVPQAARRFDAASIGGATEKPLRLDEVISKSTPSTTRHQARCHTDPVKVGDMVLLPDGLIRLTCTVVGQGEITCQIKKTEEIGSPRGVNLLGLVVELPALLEKDNRDLDWGVEHDIDFVAASFIRKASEPKFVAPKNIFEVESLEGVQNFKKILEASQSVDDHTCPSI
ncbi:hypothetical protein PHYSODRAFT_342480 [Phytophthora sojae]|uniref:pyruvate kinase n=1 Tax=Phytophthora sojae (strain P6497) TaxID=1094619 RepID=G5AGQ8_PHYSP|nr:hypothetical protein PHYSODRAFT_342480 [Phytophthora sojae]EGZ05338.1 hypothetical protein PHYSODRAFT_342480 [Phytophthora sojae]|eukprot:XP_009539259.1 hypothetical protein PHYSODRAFT_342480 [Phytophthora sojae]